jgi:hypothetical protein
VRLTNAYLLLAPKVKMISKVVKMAFEIIPTLHPDKTKTNRKVSTTN